MVKDEKAAVLAAMSTLGMGEDDYAQAKLVYIRSTGAVDKMAVSESVYQQLRAQPDIQLLAGPEPMLFSQSGELLNFKRELFS